MQISIKIEESPTENLDGGETESLNIDICSHLYWALTLLRLYTDQGPIDFIGDLEILY